MARASDVWQRTLLALRAWAQPDNNPFLALSVRREARRNKPLLTLAGLCTLACLMMFGGLRAWHFFEQFSQPAWRRASHPVVPSTLGFRLPDALGHNILGLAALVVLACCAYFAIWATRTRANAPLRAASLGGSLEEWQLLPLREERWVWMLAAHPCGVALLCALAGAPMYALAIFTGIWEWRDLLGIALIFAWIGHAVPRWTPRTWAGGVGRLDTKKYQRLVKEARGGRALSELSPEERFEYERRIARALTQSYDASPSRRSMRGSNGLQRWIMRAFGAMFFSQFAFGLLVTSFRGGGVPDLLPPVYADALPPGTMELIPTLPLTWPLVVGRFLTAPLPFFALHLPPAILIIPFAVARYHSRFLALAAQVSASETFWTAQRARLRRSWNITAWVLGIIIVAGYGWWELVPGTMLSHLLVGAPLTASASLAAGWTLFVIGGAIFASSRPLEEPLRLVRAGKLTSSQGWRDSLRGIVSGWGVAMVLFFLLCIAGGVHDFGPDWRGRALPVLLTCAAFLTIEWGFAVLRTSLPPHFRGRMVWARAAWYYGPLLAFVILSLVRALTSTALFSANAPWLLISPWASLAGLFRFHLAPPPIPFALSWIWPAALNTALGLMMIAFAGARKFAGLRSTEMAPLESGSLSLWARFKKSLVDFALRLLWLLGRLPAWIAQTYEKANLALIRPFERSDNPILRDEMRRRVRREAWLIQWIAALIGTLWALWAFGWPQFVWLSLRGSGGLTDWGAGVLAITILLAFTGALAGPVKLGVCLDRERTNGQLAFLFLTPLTEREILIGKWLPEIVHSAGLFLAALIPLILGTSALLWDGTFWALPALLFALACMSTALAWSTLAQLTGAILARKPGDGANRAALAIFGFELLCFMLIGLQAYVFGTGVTLNIIGGIILVLLHAGASVLAWRFALNRLKAARYGAGGAVVS